MKTTRKEKYVILEDEKQDLSGFANYLTRSHESFKGENVVVDISEHKGLDLKDLLMFLEVSNLHRAQKHSFVIVNEALEVEKVPEEIIVVPTMREAEDIINMEDLERELGY